MLAIGNDEMDDGESAKAGDTILCPDCGKSHILEDSIPPMLLWYKCGDITKMAGIDGKLVPRFNLKKTLE